MSTETEHVDEDLTPSVLETWDRWYHLPIIGVVMLFMLWVRTRAYDRFVTDDGTPALAAVDSWYHWRTVEWTAENYPRTMPFDLFTGFPTGRYVGQFGTLFDQLIVTAAMIVGLGNPSTETLYTVSLLAVPVMAALVAIPVFYMGRRLGGTLGGIISIVILALAPGTFLVRSTTGQLQHHVAEVLFMAIAVLAMMVALRVAERELPIWELVVDRDWEALRTPTIYSVLAGLGLTLYYWIWPPAVVLVGIFGVFFIVALCIDFIRGVSPDHLAFVGVVSFGVTGISALFLVERSGMGVTNFGYLQPALAFLGVAGFAFMAALARQWETRGIDRRYYPVAIFAAIVVALAIMSVVLPDLFDRLVREATGRLMPLDPADHRVTIQEAQQPSNYPAHVFSEFGTAFYTMLIGLVLLAIRPVFGREYRAEYTLVIVWSLFLISMSMTQIRFGYYLVLAVAVVNAVFIGDIVRLFDLSIDFSDGVDAIRQIETYQIITIFLVVMLIFAPLVPPLASADDTAWERGNMAGPSADGLVWEDSNHWLNENTPEPGDWGGAGNADQIEYFGVYEYPEDGNYAYPEGAYGIISWWDYGHLITTQAERIPHSNPFQQNARSSSAYFTAQSEERGEIILEAIAEGASVDEQSTAELEQYVEDQRADGERSHEQLRYVMIDDAMAGNKFNAITQWTGPDYYEYATPDDYEAGQPIDADEVEEFAGQLQYDDTMLSQLYFGDGAGMEHYRLVHENDNRASAFISYAIIETARDQVLLGEDGQPQITVNRQFTANVQQELQMIEQHPELDVVIFEQRQGPAVKTYERVEGATITGEIDDESVGGENNATVIATLDLESNVDREFTYFQEASVEDDGSFELPVPYATDDELGVDDGYTDSAVHAIDQYNISVVVEDDQFGQLVQYEGQTAVSESAVIHGESVAVTLDDVDPFDFEMPEEEDDLENGDGDGEDTDEDGEATDDEDGDNEDTDDTETGDDPAADDNDEE